jgi:hypothetical protein
VFGLMQQLQTNSCQNPPRNLLQTFPSSVPLYNFQPLFNQRQEQRVYSVNYSSVSTKSDVDAFTSSEINPIDKWKIIEPYWHKVKYTGSGQVIQNTINELYHIPQLSQDNIPELEEKYQAFKKKGFYKETDIRQVICPRF